MSALVQEIEYRDPALTFQLFIDKPYAVLLDSAKQISKTGRYSYIGCNPFSILTCKNREVYLDDAYNTENVFDLLKKLLKQYQIENHANMPPFQGGMMGYFGYDLCHQLENIPSAKINDMQFSDLEVGFYDLVLAFDHQLKKAWIFSSGLPEHDDAKRLTRAQNRLQFMANILARQPSMTFNGASFCKQEDIISNFSQRDYMNAVQKTIDYVYAGDIFQANISQRFSVQMHDGFLPWQLYQKLRRLNPAPFSAYLQLSDTIIASASPERFLQLQTGKIETRPIKGTRPRSQDPNIDQQTAIELVNSAKDKAENIMIVDLLRNDLSKVCHDHSVNVTQLCALETYEAVHHLTSAIQGILTEENTAIELLRATFPGGSVTGAPKIRAMEIIYEIEPHARGPYCGCIGYIGFDGSMDTSVTIRTFVIKNNIVTFQTGGAIVADSDPHQEYLESLVKAQPLINALIQDVS